MSRPRRQRKHPPSSIDLLEPEVRDMVDELIKKGWTLIRIKEELDALNRPDVDISMSAIGRRAVKVRDAGQLLREQRQLAKMLVQEADPGDEQLLADLNIELAQTALMQLQLAALTEEGATFTPKAVQTIASAASLLGRARNLSLQATEKVKAVRDEEWKLAATKVAADKSNGLSQETVDKIYDLVLGVT